MARRPINYDELAAAQMRWPDYDKQEPSAYQRRTYSKQSVKGEDDPMAYFPENIDVYKG